MNTEKFVIERTLPEDLAAAALVGRVWRPGGVDGSVEGPCVVAVRDGRLVDLSAQAPTLSALLEREDRKSVV